MLRIITGQRRGHKIEGPADRKTRPTSEIVRESMFNILRDEVEGLPVVDLFAGAGALGLEALSRGATRATFVERNRENAAVIRRNLATLRYEDRGAVLPVDVFRWARGLEPPTEPWVVFLDPPYREYENHPERIGDLLADLVAKLPAGSVLVVEAGGALTDEMLPGGAGAWNLRRFGQTHVGVLRIGDGGAEIGPVAEEPAE